MMPQLLHNVDIQFDAQIRSKVAKLIGLSEDEIELAIEQAVPCLLYRISQKGSTRKGADTLITLMRRNDFEGLLSNGLGAVLRDDETTAKMIDMGGEMVWTVFENKFVEVQDTLSGKAGIRKEKIVVLMSLIIPVALDQISKMYRVSKLNAVSLMTYLIGQKTSLRAALSSGMATILSDREQYGMVEAESYSYSRSSQSSNWLKRLVPIRR